MSHCQIYMECERCRLQTLEKLIYYYYTQSAPHDNKMQVNLDIEET